MKYENYVYEGYGPGGVAIMMEVMTDNKNRTVPDIRHIMSKNGGNLGESGCVNWMFEKKGMIVISKESISEENLMEVFDMDVDDINQEEDSYEIITSPENFGTLSKFFEEKNIEIEGQVSLVPKNTINVSENEAVKIIKLLELIEDQEDVQKVHSNFQIN